MRSSRLYRSAGARLVSHQQVDNFAVAGSLRHWVIATSEAVSPASTSSTFKRGYARQRPPASQTLPSPDDEPRPDDYDKDLDKNRWAEPPPAKPKKYSKGMFKDAFVSSPTVTLLVAQHLNAVQ